MILDTLNNLLNQTAFLNLEWGNYVMILVACFFLYLAIRHGFEPLLLVPIAFGMLLVNIYPDIMAEPYTDVQGLEHAGGLFYYFFQLDEWSILPSLIFLGVGAMTDFGPLIANPISFIMGAAAQKGVVIFYINVPIISSLRITHAASTRRETIHSMKIMVPGRQRGECRLKVSSTPLYISHTAKSPITATHSHQNSSRKKN